MNAKLTSLIAILLGGATLVAFLVMGGGADPGPGPSGPSGPSALDPMSVEDEREGSGFESAADDTSGRSRSADESAPAPELTERRAALSASGRVVSRSGSPVAGATVAMFARRDARAMFERGGFRPGGGVDFRALFRSQEVSDPVRTDSDGRFEVRGRAFEASSLEVAVQHDRFAPAVVRREWAVDQGELVLEDIVVDTGALVSGQVVDGTGRGVPNATVSYEPRSGGRGGRGGFGGRGGRFGGTDRLADLIGELQTDGSGFFRFERVPDGGFALAAEASLHVPGRSDTLEVESGQDVDAGRIELGPGALVAGIVLGPEGPIAGAEVEARSSNIEPAEERGDGDRGRGRDRGGRGGGRGGRSFQSVETDENGRFVLDMVPQQVLRITASHPSYIDGDVDPVDPTSSHEVEVALERRLAVRGIVADARTGKPVETFGIEARRIDRGFGRGRGGFDRGNFDRGRGRDGEADPEREARIAEEQARREREDAWRKERVGGSGEVPGRTPAPTRHAGGAFEVLDLEPGQYVFDIDAPGYVKVAAGPLTIEPGRSYDGVQLQVLPGVALHGTVADLVTGDPVAGARVALVIPPVDGAAAEPRNTGFDLIRSFGRGRGGGGDWRSTVASVRTDESGRFEFGPQNPGPFVLTVEADEYPDMRQESFNLAAGRTREVVELKLDPGARIWGLVHDLPRGDSARVTLTHAETSETRRVEARRLDGNTGEYEAKGLIAGGWHVRVEQRGDRGQDWRSRIGTAVAERTSEPDVFVGRNGEVRYDIGAQAEELGSVEGKVFRNGTPGGGLEVRLAMLDLPSSVDGMDENIQRFMRGRLASMFRDGVDGDDGAFHVTSVPPGRYRLEVHAGRGGRGGSGALHTQEVTVTAGAASSAFVELTTGAVHVVLQTPEGEPLQRARLAVVSTAEVGDTPVNEWRRLDSYRALTPRNGEVVSKDLPPGNYRYAVQTREYAQAVGDLAVLVGDTAAPVTIRVEPRPEGESNGAGSGGPPAGNGTGPTVRPGGANPGGNRGGGRRGR